MELTECPNCLTHVIPTKEGLCPSCRLSASQRVVATDLPRSHKLRRPSLRFRSLMILLRVLIAVGYLTILLKAIIITHLLPHRFLRNTEMELGAMLLFVLLAMKGPILFISLCKILASSASLLSTSVPDPRRLSRRLSFEAVSGPVELLGVFVFVIGCVGAVCSFAGGLFAESIRIQELLLHWLLSASLAIGLFGAWLYRLSLGQRLLTEQGHVTQLRSTLYSTPIVMCLAAIWSSTLSAAPPARQEFSAIQSFQSAAEPYSKAAYDRDGYVDRSGVIHGNGLGCSAYVSAVLHRMRYGADWKTNYDLTVHQGYGDSIAAHFGLQKAATVSAATLCDTSAVQKLQLDQKLRTGTLYLFNVRRDEQGHVGFVRVNSNGTLTQSHYSGLKAINGLATGNFADWISASQYRDSDVELYPVPEPTGK